MWCGLGQSASAGKRELLPVAAALVSVIVCCSTACDGDHLLPGWKARCHLCSCECGTFRYPGHHPSAVCCWLHQECPSEAETMLLAPLPQLGSLSPLLSQPPLGSIPPFQPHAPRDELWVSAAGVEAMQEHVGAAGCLQLSGWVFFLAEGPGSLQLRLIII